MLATMLVALVLLIAAVSLAIKSAQAALDFLPSLNTARPALASASPPLGNPTRRLARRVVLVIVDGLRLDASYGRPFLDGMRTAGIDARAFAHFPTLSYPNYVALFTGVDPRRSGTRTNNYAPPVLFDSLFARVRAAGMRAIYLSDGTAGLPKMFAGHLDEGVVAPWPQGMERSARTVLERDDELVVFLLDGVDRAGHRWGAVSREYRHAVAQVDDLLSRLLGDFDLNVNALVVVADHGHVDSGGHGGTEPEVVAVPLIMAGAGIRAGATVLDACLVDVAPTVGTLLGLPAPRHSLGQTLVHALALGTAEQSALAVADRQRHAELHPMLDTLEREAGQRLLVSRSRRGALVAPLVVLAAALVARLARRGIVCLDRRVLLIAVPAFPLTFYTMVLVFERFLSPSMLPSREPLAYKLLLYGLVAALANLGSAWYALAGRASPRQRLAAAAGLVLVGLILALVPASAAWILAGEHYARDVLPGPRFLVIPPTAYTAVCCYGFSATVTMAIEYIVFLSRALDPARLRPSP
ncbi:MAG: alkaline phosphatase family protein [Pseudomonadota bacterium]